MFEDLIDNMDVDDEVNNEVSKEEVIVDKMNDERCINTIVDNILNKYGSFIEDDNEKVAAKLNEHDDKNIRQVANRPNNASLETCSGLIKGDGSCKGKNLVKMDDEANLVKELAFEFMNKKCPRVRKNVLSPVEQFDAETEFQFIAYCVQNSLFDQLCEFLDPKEDPEEEEEFPDFVFGKDPDGKEKEEDEESDESECSDGWEKVKRKRKKKRKDSKDCKEKKRRREKGKSRKGNVEEGFKKENEERKSCPEKEGKDGKENDGEKEGVIDNNAVRRISFDVNIRVVNGDGSIVIKSDNNFSDKIKNTKSISDKSQPTKIMAKRYAAVVASDENMKERDVVEEVRPVSIDDFSQFPPLQSTSPVNVPKPPVIGAASDPLPQRKNRKLAVNKTVVECPECSSKLMKCNLNRHIKKFHKGEKEKQLVNKGLDDDELPELNEDDIFDVLSKSFDDEGEGSIVTPNNTPSLKRNVSKRYPSANDDSVIEADGSEKKKPRESDGGGMMTSTQMNFNDQLNLCFEEDDVMDTDEESSGGIGGSDVMSPMSGGGSDTKFISFEKTMLLGDISVADTFNEIRKLVEEKEKLEIQMDAVVANGLEADEKINNLMSNLDVIRDENHSLHVMLDDLKQMVKDREVEINRLKIEKNNKESKINDYFAKDVGAGASGTVMRSVEQQTEVELTFLAINPEEMNKIKQKYERIADTTLRTNIELTAKRNECERYKANIIKLENEVLTSPQRIGNIRPIPIP